MACQSVWHLALRGALLANQIDQQTEEKKAKYFSPPV